MLYLVYQDLQEGSFILGYSILLRLSVLQKSSD